MKTKLVIFAVSTILFVSAYAQSTDTISKAKTSGAITMGVRDSSGALSYTLGDCKYAGAFRVDVQAFMCQRRI